MPFDPTRPPHPPKPWEQRLREAGESAEQDDRKLINTINDAVVPDIRRNGAEALRAAATELHRLAERMDDVRKPQSPPPLRDVPKP